MAGYIVAALGHLPGLDEQVRVGDHELMVIELDGRRVARVRVTSASPDLTSAEASDETPAPPDPAS